PGGGVGRAGTARDETDAGSSSRLATRLRHDCGATFMAAYRDRDIAIVQRVERGDVALTGHAEDVARAMNDELIDQNLGGGPAAVIAVHWLPPARFRWPARPRPPETCACCHPRHGSRRIRPGETRGCRSDSRLRRPLRRL